MGRIRTADYHCELSMDDGNQADRVNAYLQWRTVHALETIARFCDSVLYWLCVYGICYFGILAIQKLMSAGDE